MILSGTRISAISSGIRLDTGLAAAVRRGLAALPIVAAGLLLVAPQAKSAIVMSGGRSTELTVAGSNGYRISVEGSGRDVSLDTSRGPIGSMVWTDYSAHGRSSRSELRARFGKFGRVSVKFKPSGKVERGKPPRGCKGKSAVTRLGVFVGTIHFVGERRYTVVRSRRARGSVTSWPVWRCKKQAAPQDAGHEPLPELRAWAPSRSFNASQLRLLGGLEGAFLMASERDRWGGIRIDRTASAIGGADSFTVDEGLTSATVSPPPPFHGTATFQRNPDGTTSWLGSLSVSFPGVDDVTLAGPDFSSELVAR